MKQIKKEVLSILQNLISGQESVHVVVFVDSNQEETKKTSFQLIIKKIKEMLLEWGKNSTEWIIEYKVIKICMLVHCILIFKTLRKEKCFDNLNYQRSKIKKEGWVHWFNRTIDNQDMWLLIELCQWVVFIYNNQVSESVKVV